MHLRKDIDITKFMEDIKKCTGSVHYKTLEGDILDLSSTLSQFIFCTIAIQPQHWNTGIVCCDKKEDYSILGKYLEGNTNEYL